MIRDVQDEIIKIKKEKDICILAHSYQAREIIEISDYSGDSFFLSVMAGKAAQKTVIMCGVRFMAETVKILSPEKTVFLANPEAGCPMAETLSKDAIRDLKRKYPGYTAVAYVNTTAEVKTVCDMCVTSSSAVGNVGGIKNKDILFIPDRNLGDYVARQLPGKNIRSFGDGCPVHAAITPEDVEKAKRAHPDALLMVHPECVPEVVEAADFVGSTSAITDYAIKSDCREFIVGTEISITENLQYMCPNKHFYPLSAGLICPDMKRTTLVDVYRCVSGLGGEEIVLDEEIIAGARRSLDKMIGQG
ncbi:MAG: quinolinate synthase NadA [Eubacteriales bacterium]|jgi:quinolinate synthase|nr:quinolinate synthase NadA [Eubacteriales bacterium]